MDVQFRIGGNAAFAFKKAERRTGGGSDFLAQG